MYTAASPRAVMQGWQWHTDAGPDQLKNTAGSPRLSTNLLHRWKSGHVGVGSGAGAGAGVGAALDDDFTGKSGTP